MLKELTWKYMRKNVSPNEVIGGVGPVCCWGNIGKY